MFQWGAQGGEPLCTSKTPHKSASVHDCSGDFVGRMVPHVVSLVVGFRRLDKADKQQEEVREAAVPLGQLAQGNHGTSPRSR